jgi:hypothetical protein
MSVDIQNSVVPEQRSPERTDVSRSNKRNFEDYARTYRQLASLASDPTTRHEYLQMAEMFDQQPLV